MLDVPIATPSGWLALHPRLTGPMKLAVEESFWLDWSLDGRPAVRSLWWRCGYLRWSPYSEDDEVGEGWLVLGSPEIVARLRSDGWELACEVRTARRGGDGAEGREIVVEVGGLLLEGGTDGDGVEGVGVEDGAEAHGGGRLPPPLGGYR